MLPGARHSRPYCKDSCQSHRARSESAWTCRGKTAPDGENVRLVKAQVVGRSEGERRWKCKSRLCWHGPLVKRAPRSCSALTCTRLKVGFLALEETPAASFCFKVRVGQPPDRSRTCAARRRSPRSHDVPGTSSQRRANTGTSENEQILLKTSALLKVVRATGRNGNSEPVSGTPAAGRVGANTRHMITRLSPRRPAQR